MTYKQFLERVEYGFKSGELKTDRPLTEKELAIQYVAGVFYEEGKKSFTAEEIAIGIKNYCGEDVFNKLFTEEEKQ